MCLTNVCVSVIPPLGMIRQMTFLLSELSARPYNDKSNDDDGIASDDDGDYHDHGVDDHNVNDIDDYKS